MTMGVYIKGMEMPSTCGKCKIKNTIECNRWKLVRSVALDRHRDCPLVPVPEHGRLMDADEALKNIKSIEPEDRQSGCTIETTKLLMMKLINDAPTIIPSGRRASDGV